MVLFVGSQSLRPRPINAPDVCLKFDNNSIANSETDSFNKNTAVHRLAVGADCAAAVAPRDAEYNFVAAAVRTRGQPRAALTAQMIAPERSADRRYNGGCCECAAATDFVARAPGDASRGR